MKNIALVLVLNLITFSSYGQTEKDSLNIVKEVVEKPIIKDLKTPIYEIFPTTNTWVSLKLNTQNGKIWQVHFTIKDGYEGSLPINESSLLYPNQEVVNGRFTLYPTPNMFTFILLDQMDGSTWKVQWNNDEDKRFIRYISSYY